MPLLGHGCGQITPIAPSGCPVWGAGVSGEIAGEPAMTIAKQLPPLPIRRLARVLAVVAIAMAAGHLVQTLAQRKPVTEAKAVAVVPKDIVQLSAGNLAEPALPAAKPILVSSTDVVPEPAPEPLVAAASCPPAPPRPGHPHGHRLRPPLRPHPHAPDAVGKYYCHLIELWP